MPKKIIVSFEVPIDKGRARNSSIYFNKWIPDEPIVFIRDNFTLKLWIDKDCIPFLDDDEKISSWINMTANKIKIEIETDIKNKLANFIYDERDGGKEIHHGLQPNTKKYKKLSKKFKELGFNFVTLTIDVINRLISYVRNYDNQYWVEPISYNTNNINSLFVQWNSKVKLDDKEYFRWFPPREIMKISMSSIEDDQYINQNKWIEIEKFLNTKSRINLANELLSNSISLLFQYQHRRSAVIEATTALEVALASFSEKPNIENIKNSIDTNRIDINHLKQQVSHLGFSASIRYLVPIIFSEEVISNELLEECYKAIAVRNNIVHQGQRDVSPIAAKKYVISLNKITHILIENTRKT